MAAGLVGIFAGKEKVVLLVYDQLPSVPYGNNHSAFARRIFQILLFRISLCAAFPAACAYPVAEKTKSGKSQHLNKNHHKILRLLCRGIFV